MQDAGLVIGVGGGIGYQSVEQASAIVVLIKNLPETLQALKVIVTDPEFRARVGDQVADDYKQRIEMQTRAYNEGGWDGPIAAGVEAGRLAVDIVGVATGAMGAGKLVTKIASAGGFVVADAATTLALKAAAVFESLDASGQARWMTESLSWRAATTELAQMELDAGTKAHPLLRHGDQVDFSQLQQCALTGATPDGMTGKAVDSTRWLNNEDMLTAIKQAQSVFNTRGGQQRILVVDLGRVVGEGYYGGTTNYAKATMIKVVLDTKGMPITAYPVLP